MDVQPGTGCHGYCWDRIGIGDTRCFVRAISIAGSGSILSHGRLQADLAGSRGSAAPEKSQRPTATGANRRPRRRGNLTLAAYSDLVLMSLQETQEQIERSEVAAVTRMPWSDLCKNRWVITATATVGIAVVMLDRRLSPAKQVWS